MILIILILKNHISALMRLSIIFFVILLSCIACQPVKKASVNPNKLNSPECIDDQSNCVISTKVGDFSVLFNVKKVTTEIPFTIFVQYLGTKQIKTIDAYMEGINMFMGKIPLFFEDNAEKNSPLHTNTAESKPLYSAKTMVVACAEPNMKWRLWFTVQLFDQDQQKTTKQQFFVDFASHYN